MRKNVKSYRGTSYSVVSPDGHYGLEIREDTNSVDEVVEQIRESNLRALSKGYEAKRWLVVINIWNKEWTEDGEFLGEHRSSSVLCKVNEHGKIEL